MREHILHEFCFVTAGCHKARPITSHKARPISYTVITVPLLPFSASFTSPSEVINTFPCGFASR